ncbi:MAG: molybdopterin-binding protein [Erysipelotrichaceae bacterium]|uniref:molybdopterin-binding protein n=1 Tax=Floccifex sp. TaxID=2815810 RepID=UPI002A75297D|nr:molybdopterin-binding protein [Floccifex sp.]MDD7281370.1 molybdopterin-binding protein [Erysipelotrichaceae bacterium]MDY2958891.1 molybdopterin-binding protein [Floccifex sp.]
MYLESMDLMYMKKIKVEDAIGQVLCHDMTQIIKDVSKDAKFRKGHIVQEEDIPILLSMGKETVYVWENDETMMHENEAAEVLCSLCLNENMKRSEVKEGKIEICSTIDGLFKIQSDKLRQVNHLGEMMIATRHSNTVVHPNDKLAGMRIIPLVIKKEKMEPVQRIEGPIFEIKPFQIKKAAIITTGSEVYKGRIKDTFTPVLIDKLKEYNVSVMYHKICDDNDEMVTQAILEAIHQGAQFVLCTGGMSVDPDDKTPLAIKNTGANIITYGAPVLPGAMFLLSYLKDVPIVGLPGCVMYAKRTIFDIMLPRILAKDEIKKEEIYDLGEGGLCLNCKVCTYPNCGFGK